MENVRQENLKKCIFKIIDDFRDDLYKIFGKQAEFQCDFDGMSVYLREDELFLGDEDLASKLSEFYDVDVTSIHIDDCDLIGVWIVYKEKNNG